MYRFLAQETSPEALSPCTSQSASCREQVKLGEESKGDQKSSQEVRATTQDRGDSNWGPGESRGGGEGRATASRGMELDMMVGQRNSEGLQGPGQSWTSGGHR